MSFLAEGYNFLWEQLTVMSKAVKWVAKSIVSALMIMMMMMMMMMRRHHESLSMHYTKIFSAVKNENSIGKFFIFLIFLLKT